MFLSICKMGKVAVMGSVGTQRQDLGVREEKSSLHLLRDLSLTQTGVIHKLFAQ